METGKTQYQFMEKYMCLIMSKNNRNGVAQGIYTIIHWTKTGVSSLELISIYKTVT